MKTTDYFERWSTVDDGTSPGWRATRRSLIAKHACPVIGDLELDEITADQFREILDRTSHLSRNTRNKILFSALRAMLTAAVASGRMDAAAYARLYAAARPIRAYDRPPPTPLTGDERDAILAHVRHLHGYEPWVFLSFLFLTGCRPSEALGLRWQDIDLPKGRALIRAGKVEGRVTELKSRRSRRVIALIPDLCAILHPGPPDGYAFKVCLRTVRESIWTPACYQLGILRGGQAPRLYATRATCASMLLSAGMPPSAVAAQLGSRPETISEFYWQDIQTAGNHDAMAAALGGKSAKITG